MPFFPGGGTAGRSWPLRNLVDFRSLLSILRSAGLNLGLQKEDQHHNIVKMNIMAAASPVFLHTKHVCVAHSLVGILLLLLLLLFFLLLLHRELALRALALAPAGGTLVGTRGHNSVMNITMYAFIVAYALNHVPMHSGFWCCYHAWVAHSPLTLSWYHACFVVVVCTHSYVSSELL